MSSRLDIAERAGRWLENLLIGTLLLAMIGLACTQIFLRNFDFGSLVWGDEAINHMVLWVAMIAGIAAAREDRHISIDVLSRFLPPFGKIATAMVVDLFTASVCIALAWYGSQLTAYALEDGDTLLIGVPFWVVQGIVPVGFALIAWRYLIWFLRRFRQLISGHAS
jgi:TRAP-type C4-dicarboxylate transport system permease small subunit